MPKSKREDDLKRLLGFLCAYCGRPKSERPPEWCVRSHEGWEASLREVEKHDSEG